MAASRIVLPVLDLEQGERPYQKRILKGAQTYNAQRIAYQSNSTSSTTFQVTPPSPNTVIDRCIQLQTDITITAAGGKYLNPDVSSVATAAGNRSSIASSTFGLPKRNCVSFASKGTPSADLDLNTIGRPTKNTSNTLTADTSAYVNVATANNLALRQFPLMNCISSLSMTINGTHFTASPGDYCQAISTYTTPEYRERVYKDTAHMPDRTPSFLTTCGYDYHPLNLAGEGTFKGETPRGYLTSQVTFDTSGNDSTAQITSITFRGVTESLMISPLLAYFGFGFTNITDLSLTINWAPSLLARTISFLNVNNFGVSVPTEAPDPSNLSVSFGSDTTTGPNLLLRYFTPMESLRIPAQIELPYSQLYRISKTFPGPFAMSQPAATFAMTGDSLRLPMIPSAVYIYVQQSDSVRNDTNYCLYPDFKFPLNNLSVSFGNRTNLLSSLSQKQLYALAVENGHDLDDFSTATHVNNASIGLNQTDSLTGVVLKLEFGKDIGLQDYETPGLRGDYHFRADVTTLFPYYSAVVPIDAGGSEAYMNGASASFKYGSVDLKMVFVYPGKVTIRPNECAVETGVLTVSDVQGAEDVDGSYNSFGKEDEKPTGGHLIGGGLSGGHLIGGGFSHMAKAFPHVLRSHGRAVMESAAPAVKELISAYKSRS